MPIYEFRCKDCGAKSSVFFRHMTVAAEGACKRCGSGNTNRIFSAFRVRMAKPGVDQLNKAELLDGVDYTNPHSMANFFRNMGDAFQDEPDEGMTEVVERLDHGEPVHEALQLDMGHDHAAHSHDTPDDD
jgi:putative FmdB family regulatory protein